MPNVLDDTIQAAADIKTKRDQIVVDAAVLRAVVQGPATGETSTVDSGGEAGDIKTLARVMAEAAGRVGLQYRFAGAGDTTANPGAGNIVADDADWAEVGEIAVSAVDINGLSQAGALADADKSTTLLNRAQILIQPLTAGATVVLRVVGATVAGDGFYRLAVAKRSSAGTIADNAEVGMLIVPTGDRGGNNYTVSGWFPGDAMPAGGEQLIRHRCETDVLMVANFAGWSITTKTPPDEDAVYTVRTYADIDDEVGTVKGTLTIAEGEKSATGSGAEFTIPDGVFFSVCAPDPPVTGISDLLVVSTGTQVIA